MWLSRVLKPYHITSIAVLQITATLETNLLTAEHNFPVVRMPLVRQMSVTV